MQLSQLAEHADSIDDLGSQRDYFGAHTFRVVPGKENERLKTGEDIRKSRALPAEVCFVLTLCA